MKAKVKDVTHVTVMWRSAIQKVYFAEQNVTAS